MNIAIRIPDIDVREMMKLGFAKSVLKIWVQKTVGVITVMIALRVILWIIESEKKCNIYYIQIMVKSYCVKEKRQSDCVPGSETYVRATNGRLMMKCKCISCSITKTKFVKGN